MPEHDPNCGCQQHLAAQSAKLLIMLLNSAHTALSLLITLAPSIMVTHTVGMVKEARG